jgi:hypothetical protein
VPAEEFAEIFPEKCRSGKAFELLSSVRRRPTDACVVVAPDTHRRLEALKVKKVPYR